MQKAMKRAREISNKRNKGMTMCVNFLVSLNSGQVSWVFLSNLIIYTARFYLLKSSPFVDL